MSCREIKSNTYVTFTNFPYFLHNLSSCKRVIIEILQQVSVTHLPTDTVANSVSQKKIRHVFLNSGDQTCPSLKKKKKKFKGVVLELLAPICKREKSGIRSYGFFPPEVSFPALDGGVDRLSTEAVHLWSDLVCPLPTQASYSSLPVLPPRRDGDATGVDLMAFQTNLVSYHQNL